MATLSEQRRCNELWVRLEKGEPSAAFELLKESGARTITEAICELYETDDAAERKLTVKAFDAICDALAAMNT